MKNMITLHTIREEDAVTGYIRGIEHAAREYDRNPPGINYARLVYVGVNQANAESMLKVRLNAARSPLPEKFYAVGFQDLRSSLFDTVPTQTTLVLDESLIHVDKQVLATSIARLLEHWLKSQNYMELEFVYSHNDSYNGRPPELLKVMYLVKQCLWEAFQRNPRWDTDCMELGDIRIGNTALETVPALAEFVTLLQPRIRLSYEPDSLESYRRCFGVRSDIDSGMAGLPKTVSLGTDCLVLSRELVASGILNLRQNGVLVILHPEVAYQLWSFTECPLAW